MIPAPLQTLIKQLSALPGLGPRSAQKAALYLLTRGDKLQYLQHSLAEVSSRVVHCGACGNIGLNDPCHVCADTTRDVTLLCVVEGVDDLWALERGGAFKGLYHVLGGVISALDGIGPEQLRMAQLIKRIREGDFREVILALGASVDGQTTAHLLSRRMKEVKPDLSITTLAKGMPMGADVDYLDDGTLSLALQGRRAVG